MWNLLPVKAKGIRDDFVFWQMKLDAVETNASPIKEPEYNPNRLLLRNHHVKNKKTALVASVELDVTENDSVIRIDGSEESALSPEPAPYFGKGPRCREEMRRRLDPVALINNM